MIGISGSLIWSKTVMELKFNTCDEFRWSPEDPVSQIHSPHVLAGALGIFSDLLRFVQMLKRECGAEIKGKLPHLFIPSKTATQVSQFAMEDLPLGRIATLVPEFAVKDLSLGRTRWWSWWSGQKPWWNWYLTPVLNFGEVRRAQLAKSTLLTSSLVPLGSFQIF